MQLNEAVKEAIKILSEIHVGNMTQIAEEAWKSAIKILDDGLQLTQQKSVTHLPCCGYADTSAIKWNPYNSVVQCHNCGQVYTAPQPARQPLTDEQMYSLYSLYCEAMKGYYVSSLHHWRNAEAHKFARAIEEAVWKQNS